MNERDDELEDLFRERFSEKEAPISPRVWNNVKKSLPPEGDSKKPFWKNPITFFGMVLGFLLIASVLWWLSSSDSRKNDQLLSEELPVAKNENARKEKSDNNDKINLTENSNGLEIEHYTEKQERIEGNDQKLDYSSGVNTMLKDDSKTTKSEAETNAIENIPKRRGDKQSRSGKKENDELTASETSNNSGRNRNTADQKEISISSENNRNKHNPMSENSQKDKIDETKIGGKKNESDQGINSNDKNNSNRFIADANKNSKNETSSANEKPVSGNGEKSKTGKDKDNNNTISSEVNPNLKKEIFSSNESTINRSEEKNKNNLLQNNPKDPATETIQDLSSTGLKENEKRHELTQDSSVSSTQKEHALMDQNGMSDNLENHKEKVYKDSIANAPMIVMVSPDSIKPVIDTLVEAKTDSIIKADSTDKKEKKKKPKLSRWSVDLLAGPMITGATTQANDLSFERAVNAKNQQDKNLLNFSGGGMVNYSLSSRFYISTGVLYSGYSEKYFFKNTKDFPTVTSYIREDSAKLGQDTIYTHFPTTVYDTTLVSKEYSDKKKDQYSFISAPLNVSVYLWRREKIALLATAGIRANLMMKSTTYITNDSLTGLIEYSERVQKVTFSYMASVAMEYQLKNKIYLLVQPTVNHQAGSIYAKSSALNQKPYSVGMNVGLRIKF